MSTWMPGHVCIPGMKRLSSIFTLFLLAGRASGQATTEAADKEPMQHTSSPAVTKSAPTASAYDGPTLPDSSWSRELTAEQVRRAGMPNADIRLHFGPDGWLPLTLQFVDDTWSTSLTNDSGVDETGDVGTLEYDDRGRMWMTSNSEGCPGCVSTMAWTIRGDGLSLEPAGALPGGDPLERLIMGGTWTREG